MEASQAVLLQQIPIPSQDDVINFVRAFRGSLHCHRMYPPGHRMITSSLERLQKHLLAMMERASVVALSSTGDVMELNGEKITRQVQERDQSTEIVLFLEQRGIQTMVFLPQITTHELSELFLALFEYHPERGGIPPGERLPQLLPTIRINQTVVRRTSSSMTRDKLSLEEIFSTMDRQTLLRELGLNPDRLTPELQDALLQQAVESGQVSLPGMEQEENHQSAERERAQALEDRLDEPEEALIGQPIGEPQNLWERQESGTHPPLSPDHPLDPSLIDWSRLSPDQEREIFSRLDPVSLFSSSSFQNFLESGGLQKYLSNYFEDHLNLSQLIAQGDSVAAQYASHPETLSEIQQYVSELTQSASRLMEQELQQVMEASAQQIASMVPQLVNRYLLSLSHEESSQGLLRQQVLQNMPSEQTEQAGQLLMKEMSHLPDPTSFEENAGLLVEMLDQQMAKGALPAVERALRNLAEQKGRQGEGRWQAKSLSRAIEETECLLADNLSRLSDPNTFEHNASMLLSTVQQHLDEGTLTTVERLLERIGHQQHQQEERWKKKGISRALERIGNTQNLQNLIGQAVRPREGTQARQVLARLAQQSVPYCVDELRQSQNTNERLQNLELLLELGPRLTPQDAKQSFRSLLKTIDEVQGEPRQFELLCDVARQIDSTEFEKYIASQLATPQGRSNLPQLVHQAISLDTPLLRDILLGLFQERGLAEHPEQEELLLQYLHRNNVADGVELLFQTLDDPQQDPALRHSAVWMLGSLQSAASLQAIQDLLTAQTGPQTYKYDEDIRFQALDTLKRYPPAAVAPLLQQALEDPSPLVQGYARHLAASSGLN